jgi:competence protein ComEC
LKFKEIPVKKMKRLPLFWLATAFIIGIPCGAYLMVPGRMWLTLVLISAILFFLEITLAKRIKNLQQIRTFLPVPFFLILLFLVLGGWRYSITTQPFKPANLAFYNDSGKQEISGVICEDPQLKENSSQLILCADSIKLANGDLTGVKGKALIKIRPGNWHYGDDLTVYGALKLPPETEDFSYRAYLEQHGIHSLIEFPYIQVSPENKGSRIKTFIFEIRRSAYQRINAFLPQPEAGLLSGILLGIENDIPYDLKKAYQDTGTAHVIAISGFNMTLLVGLFLKGFRRWLPVWWAGLVTIVLISIYTILVGAAPAVVRAAVMSCLAMSGRLIGRKQAGPFTLLITAAVMCAFNPLLLWEAGFQLSVTATLGLVLYADRLMDWFTNLAEKRFPATIVNTISGPIGEYFLFTLAAQVTTLPVILYHFEQLSLSTLIANPLILPVQPMIMMLGGVAVITGLIIAPLGKLISYLVWVPLVYTNKIVAYLAQIPDSVINFGQISVWVVFLLYGLLAFLTFGKKDDKQSTPIKQKAFVALMLISATMLVWNAVLLRPENKLSIFVMDEPNTGVLLVQTPSGKSILFNSGDHTNALSAELTKYLPVLNHEIDVMLVTSAKATQYQAFPRLLERFKTRQFIWAVPFPKTATAGQIREQVITGEINSEFISSGMVIDCGDGVQLEMVSGDESSATFRLKYGELVVWLPGGEIDPGREEWLVQDSVVILPEDVSNADDWVVLQPMQIIQHESGLCIFDSACLSTGERGWIKLESDGKQLWVSGER